MSDYDDDDFEDDHSVELEGHRSRRQSDAASRSSFFGDEEDKVHIQRMSVAPPSPAVSKLSTQSSLQRLPSVEAFSTTEPNVVAPRFMPVDYKPHVESVQRSPTKQSPSAASNSNEIKPRSSYSSYEDDTHDDAGPVDEDDGVHELAIAASVFSPTAAPKSVAVPSPVAEHIVAPAVDVITPVHAAPAPAPAPFVFKRAPLISSTFDALPAKPVKVADPIPDVVVVDRAPVAVVTRPSPPDDEDDTYSDDEDGGEDDDEKGVPSVSPVSLPGPKLPNSPAPVIGFQASPSQPSQMVQATKLATSDDEHSGYASDEYEDDYASDDHDENDDRNSATGNPQQLATNLKAASATVGNPAVSGNAFLAKPVVDPVAVGRSSAPLSTGEPRKSNAPLQLDLASNHHSTMPGPPGIATRSVVDVHMTGSVKNQPPPYKAASNPVPPISSPSTTAAPSSHDPFPTPMLSAGSSVSAQSSYTTAAAVAAAVPKPAVASRSSIVRDEAVPAPIVLPHVATPPKVASIVPSPAPAGVPSRSPVKRVSVAHSPPTALPVSKDVETRIVAEKARVDAAVLIQLAWRAVLHRRDLKHVLQMKKRLAYFEPDGGRGAATRAYLPPVGVVAWGSPQSQADAHRSVGGVVYHKGVPYRSRQEVEELERQKFNRRRSVSSLDGPRDNAKRAQLYAGVKLRSQMPPRGGSDMNGRIRNEAKAPALPKAVTRADLSGGRPLYKPRHGFAEDAKPQGRVSVAQQHPRPSGNVKPAVASPQLKLRGPPPSYDINGRKHLANERDIPVVVPRHQLPVVAKPALQRPAWAAGGRGGSQPPVPRQRGPQHGNPSRFGAVNGRLPPTKVSVPTKSPVKSLVPSDVKFDHSPSKLPVPKWRVSSESGASKAYGDPSSLESRLRQEAMKMHRSKKELDDALFRLNAGMPS